MSERRTLGRTIQQVYEGEVSELVCTDLGGFLSECPICVFYVLSSISLCWRRVREHFESILDSGIIILSWVVWGLVRWCVPWNPKFLSWQWRAVPLVCGFGRSAGVSLGLFTCEEMIVVG